MNNKIAFYTPPFTEMQSYFQMIDAAEKYGISAVELLSIFELSTPDKEAAKRIKEYADSKNIKIPCVSLFINIAEETRERCVQKLKAYIDIASIVESPYFHHTIISEIQYPEKVIPYKRELMEKGISIVREIYDYAETLGVKTVYEDQGYIFNGIDNFGEFLSNVNREVGVVADFGNIYQSNDIIYDFIEAFSDNIVHVHLKDIILSENNESEKGLLSLNGKYMNATQIGTGIINFEKCVSLLKKSDYNGFYSLEYGGISNDSNLIDILKYVDNLLLKKVKRLF